MSSGTLRYILKRLALVLGTAFFVSSVTFLAIHALPGSPLLWNGLPHGESCEGQCWRMLMLDQALSYSALPPPP